MGGLWLPQTCPPLHPFMSCQCLAALVLRLGGWGDSGTWVLPWLRPSFLEGEPKERRVEGGISGLEAWAPQHAPCCRRLPTSQADRGAVLPGASQPSLVWLCQAAHLTVPMCLPWSPAGVPWPRARPSLGAQTLIHGSLFSWFTLLVSVGPQRPPALHDGETEAQRGKGAGCRQNWAESCVLPKPLLANPIAPQKLSFTNL